MMEHKTQPYKRSVAGSIGAGIESLFGGSGKQYYILEHKITTKYHKAGESQEIIVDQIELGRDSKCQVRFDESFNTVSRRHAAIVKDSGGSWKLIQLSQINSTFLNGRKVEKEWYLQNGDEIQLSVNGPKLGFIVPAGKKSTVGSLGLSHRFSLFRQQALRPYKQAIAALSIFMILSIAGLVSWKIYGDIQWEKRDSARAAEYAKNMATQDSITDALLAKNREYVQTAENMRKQQEKMKKNFENRIKDFENRIKNMTPGQVSGSSINNAAIDACLPHIYFVAVTKMEVTSPGGEVKTIEGGLSGTGFLLSDGRFVTARHVAEPWFFVISGGTVDDEKLFLNKVAHNGGKVTAHFIAISSSGDRLSFTSEQFTCDRSHDETGVDDDGFSVRVAKIDETDWAYIKTNKQTGLKFDSSKSASLERGTRLTVLGFPLRLGVNAPNDIQPILGSAITSRNGLNQGVILTTDTNYEQGNSGGPVFYTDASGALSVIGIVSAGAGKTVGFIVPIAIIN
jgi:S1-C subfamily serine protease